MWNMESEQNLLRVFCVFIFYFFATLNKVIIKSILLTCAVNLKKIYVLFGFLN
jgi:hypothetical protein